MSMNIEKLVEVAESLKIASLKAWDNDIFKYDRHTDSFVLYDKQFKEVFKDKSYKLTISDISDCKYHYEGIIDGLKFEAYTRGFLFPDDIKRLEVKNA